MGRAWEGLRAPEGHASRYETLNKRLNFSEPSFLVSTVGILVVLPHRLVGV